jgi:hypothetical protein
MNTFLRFFSLLFIIFLSSCAQFKESTFLGREKTQPWTHLELGAGNYGEDGHTKKSQRKTVLKKLTYVSKIPNYIDQLPEKDPNPYNPKQQYAILFLTLENLVTQRGPKGIFHVNDLVEEYAQHAAIRLSQYAQERRYDQVIIEPIGGDYMDLTPLRTLEKYKLTHYDSVHLKNPEVSFYHYGMDGDNMLSTPESRKKARTQLQYLANFSKEGLYFFPIDEQDSFIPQAEKKEFINKGIFYLPTTAWDPVPYYFPEGTTIDKKFGKVYFIKSQINNSKL